MRIFIHISTFNYSISRHLSSVSPHAYPILFHYALYSACLLLSTPIHIHPHFLLQLLLKYPTFPHTLPLSRPLSPLSTSCPPLSHHRPHLLVSRELKQVTLNVSIISLPATRSLHLSASVKPFSALIIPLQGHWHLPSPMRWSAEWKTDYLVSPKYI